MRGRPVRRGRGLDVTGADSSPVPLWDDFSAFGDIAELEHVCEMLAENASVATEHRDRPEFLTGEKSILVKRLNIQAAAMERLLEQERPGLYRRTWMAHLFIGLFNRLYDVTERPETLAEEVPTIALELHKVLIAAHHVFDPAQRERLLAVAEAHSRIREGGKKGQEHAYGTPDEKQTRYALWQTWVDSEVSANGKLSFENIKKRVAKNHPKQVTVHQLKRHTRDPRKK